MVLDAHHKSPGLPLQSRFWHCDGIIMQPITFTRDCYRLGDEPVHLNSGEFHYFRVPRADWETRMRLFREAGGNCIATYIPWLLHEPREGEFVFTSENGHLNLEEFLTTARRLGLHVIARPGPYQYSELVHSGLPRWLVEQYPQLLARDLAGQLRNAAAVSYTHPVFLEKARRWFAVVGPIIARHTVSRGGAVALTQFDNELTGIQLWSGGPDYNPETFGFGRADGYYPQFLQRRYRSLAALNTAYAAPHARWEDARPVEQEAATDLAGVCRARDYFDCYLASVADYARTLVGWLRDAGVDTPFVHNSANPEMNALFLETAAALGENFLLGSDHYYALDQSWPQNNPTPQWLVRCFQSLEMLRLMGYPPSVFEMPGGSLSDWPPITAEDGEVCYRAHVAIGMKGHNYYIYTGGPNPPGAGVTADVYDYNAAIGPFGEVRPLYEAQKRFGQFLLAHPWLAEAGMECDLRVVFDFEYARWRDYGKSVAPLTFTGSQAQEFLRRGVLTTAFCASFLPGLADAASDEWVADTTRPVFIVSAATMSRAKQERIVKFLQAGGRAVIAPVLPEYDEQLQPCPVLKNFLGAPRATRARRFRGEDVRLSFRETANVFVNGEIFAWDNLPADAQVLGRDELTNRPIAWATLGGRAVVLGLQWSHGMREHAGMLGELLRPLGLQPRVTCSNPNVWCTLRSRGRQSALFAINLFTSPQTAEINLIGPVTLPPMSVLYRELTA